MYRVMLPLNRPTHLLRPLVNNHPRLQMVLQHLQVITTLLAPIPPTQKLLLPIGKLFRDISFLRLTGIPIGLLTDTTSIPPNSKTGQLDCKINTHNIMPARVNLVLVLEERRSILLPPLVALHHHHHHLALMFLHLLRHKWCSSVL